MSTQKKYAHYEYTSMAIQVIFLRTIKSSSKCFFKANFCQIQYFSLQGISINIFWCVMVGASLHFFDPEQNSISSVNAEINFAPK